MSTDSAFNLIIEPIIGARLTGERQRSFLTLPGILAALARDTIEDFPALRPHQRHPWHAFCVQLAAMTLHRAGVTEAPSDEAAWAALLRGLTPEWPDDAPWCLVSPADRPAFMQTPVPGGNLAEFKSVVATPDALDMLVTSKNHDLKSEVMIDAQPEDWVFALISLQTMSGYGGSTLYGISRMNSGSGSRPALGILPGALPGARFVRDLRVLLRSRDEVLAHNDLKASGGICLVWLEPWDGASQLRFSDLDPFYIEICRRVRFGRKSTSLHATSVGSATARIVAKQLKGRTGDPWIPIEEQDGKGRAWGEPKALTITGSGFSYQKMTELLLRKRYRPALLQKIADDDAEDALAVAACGIARDDKKTDGYHERVVPISKRVVSLFRVRATDALAGWAAERVEEAGQLRGKVLRPALLALLQDGPEQVNFRATETSDRADHFLERLDNAIDATFFDDLWQEADQADTGEDARRALRHAWHRRFAGVAHDLLVEAADSVPHASMRRYRARVRADRAFFGARNKYFPQLQAKESEGNDARTRV